MAEEATSPSTEAQDAVKDETKDEETSNSAAERMARFKALKARQAQGRKENMKASTAEAKKMTVDHEMLNKIQRQRENASHKLLKADTEASGEDFERKRAWDWTAEESEKWDKRMDKKARHRGDVAFQDYRQDARKVYKRQLREMDAPDLQAYRQEKANKIQEAAQKGELEIIEAEDGELVAVDKDGNLFSTADSLGDFTKNKPDKTAVDRLVSDLKKAEEIRMRKRRDRGLEDETGDVTYINQKNKQFNEKLARFYNKYTADIRESFERGTAI